MTYSVKEIFYTLQGEGANAGRPAVFCRFSGCNLWSGREEDRLQAICQFCDTSFVGTDGSGGGKFTSAENLAYAISTAWLPTDHEHRFVVLTGGEPLLQVDEPLIEALHRQGFTIAIETNGTIPVPKEIDWICVSPKAGSNLLVTKGDEIKLVYPQIGTAPELFNKLEFRHFFLQPMDNASQKSNIQFAMHYCLDHPQWHLSLQTHKVLQIR